MDSRLRGNDVSGCGNDVMCCENDLMVVALGRSTTGA